MCCSSVDGGVKPHFLGGAIPSEFLKQEGADTAPSLSVAVLHVKTVDRVHSCGDALPGSAAYAVDHGAERHRSRSRRQADPRATRTRRAPFRRPVVGHDELQATTAPRWQQGRTHHATSLFVAGLWVLRCRARASLRSRASLSRYDSPSIEITSARCTRRSTSDTTQAAFGNTSDQSLNALFVVTMVDL